MGLTLKVFRATLMVNERNNSSSMFVVTGFEIEVRELSHYTPW